MLSICRLSFLDENAKEMIHKKGSQWSPLLSYRNGLTGQDEEEEGMEAARDVINLKITFTKISSFGDSLAGLCEGNKNIQGWGEVGKNLLH